MTPNRNLSVSQMMFVGAVFMLIASGFLMFPFAQEASGMGISAGNAANGKALFEKRCTGCHALDRDKEGPRLGNVFGRKAGSVPSFQYSDALKSATFTWDAALMDKWLTDTESVVPENDMTFHVPKAAERADIIEYLRVSSGK